MKIKSFDEWLQDCYSEAMQWRDWQTCDFLLDNSELIRYGYEKALDQIKESEIEIHADGVKNARNN